jgi:hypothetical protein
VDTLDTLAGQGAKSMDSKVEVVKNCWSQDPVHANLHAYFKLASNTIQLIEGGLKGPSPSNSNNKRQRVASETSQLGAGSGSGAESGGSGPTKRHKSNNRFEHFSGDSHSYGYQGRFENHYGGRGGGSQFGDRSGGHHGYQEQHNDGGYGYGGYPQQRDDRYYTARGEPRGRRFHGRRPYGGRGR